MNISDVAGAPIDREPRLGVVADGVLVAASIGVGIALAAIAALPLWSAGAVFALVTGGVRWQFHRRTAVASFGLANWVTLFRVNLMTLMLLAVWQGAPGIVQAWLLFAIAAIALLLDGVDGWLARRRQEASDFGGRFDMGADTAFTIITTLCLVTFDLVGAWVLAIGLLRPSFAAAGRVWPALRLRLPESRGRKIVCAGSLACLVAGLAPPLSPFAPALALAALLLLVWSFGRDLRYLLQQELIA